MSANNGVIRIGRKGLKKFAFGEDGVPFEVDVVVTMQEWFSIDEEFREKTNDRTIATEDMPDYHRKAVEFAWLKSGGPLDGEITLTTAEALDFLARLREQYEELVVFFQPKLREEPSSPDTSEQALRFSEEPS